MEKNIKCKWKSKEHWNSNTQSYLSDQTDFKSKTIKEDKEKHYILKKKKSILEEDITVVCVCVCMYVCIQHGSTEIHKAISNR